MLPTSHGYDINFPLLLTNLKYFETYSGTNRTTYIMFVIELVQFKYYWRAGIDPA